MKRGVSNQRHSNFPYTQHHPGNRGEGQA
jgi:hypothetical protein